MITNAVPDFRSLLDTGAISGLIRTVPARARPAEPWPDSMAGQRDRPVRVIAVGDRTHLRSVVVPQLMNDPRTLLVGQGETIRDGRTLLQDKEFDVALIDLEVEDSRGFDLVSMARKARPTGEVVVLAAAGRLEDAMHALDLGAAGFLVKNAWFDNVLQAVLQVVNGGAAISPTLLRRLLFSRARLESVQELSASTESAPGGCAKLSEREREVLRMVAEGMTSCDIARRLSIGQLTVDTHMRHVAQKLHTRTRAQAVNRAKGWGLI